MNHNPTNVLEFPQDEGAIRRRGSAVELICGCCTLPFSEVIAGRGSHVVAATAVVPQGLNIYSRHYGKTHSNQVRFEGVTLRVTDRREFVIVPVTSVAALVA